MCELCELLKRRIPPLLRWDFLIYPQQNLFVIFRGPRKSMIFGESRIGSRLNCGRAAGLFDLPDECDCLFRYRNPLAKPLLTIGIFRRWLLSCILFCRVRLGLCRVVGLLERAEEGCEGLKHGYYDLPCVHFLIFLCHDIKNKIDRLVLFL